MALPHSYGNDPLEVGATFIVSIHDGRGNVVSVVPGAQNDVLCREYKANDKFQQWIFQQLEGILLRIL
jgi:hypothetical protein